MTDQTNPVNWFEIPVTDLERAKHFHETVFGFQLSLNEMGSMKMAWFPMTQDGGGATGTHGSERQVRTISACFGCQMSYLSFLRVFPLLGANSISINSLFLLD